MSTCLCSSNKHKYEYKYNYQEGFVYTINAAKTLVGMIKSKISGNNSGYNDVQIILDNILNKIQLV